MPRAQSWTKWLTSAGRVEVRLTTERADVLDFSVQYLADIVGEWRPVVRFDTAHHEAHMDVLWPNGQKETRQLKRLDNRAALTYALDDIDRRWEFYRDRYTRMLQR